VRRILLVQADVDGVIGWAECVAGETPFYSPETADTAWLILRDFLWPLIKGKEFAPPAKFGICWRVFEGTTWPRVHWKLPSGMPKPNKRACRFQTHWSVRDEIACGVSIGIKESLDELAAAVQKELAAGYQRIKIKIKPGKDLDPVRRLRPGFPRIKLLVDANSAYTLNDWPLLKQLEGFYLMMIEQPLGWDDLYNHVELQKKLDTPICLDECIHTEEHARAAIELGACKIMNIKLGRVGGHTVARRIHDLCQRHGIPVWCGGMLESRASAARTTSHFRRFPISRSPAMWPPANAIGRKISSFLKSRCQHKARFACLPARASDSNRGWSASTSLPCEKNAWPDAVRA